MHTVAGVTFRTDCKAISFSLDVDVFEMKSNLADLLSEDSLFC